MDDPDFSEDEENQFTDYLDQSEIDDLQLARGEYGGVDAEAIAERQEDLEEQRRIEELGGAEEVAYLQSQQANATELERIDEQLAQLNESYSNLEISDSVYNEATIELMEERSQLLLDSISDNAEAFETFKEERADILRRVEAASKTNKLDPTTIIRTLDDVFRKSAENLEKVSTVKLFTSQEIPSRIYEIKNLPVPQEYRNDMESLSANDPLKYLETMTKIYRHNSQLPEFVDDILYETFAINLSLTVSALRKNVFVGPLKQGETRVSVANIQESFDNMFEPYKEERKPRLFEGDEEESKELSKLMTKLRTVMVKVSRENIGDTVEGEVVVEGGQYFRRKFTNEEIKEDFERGDPAVINKKYARYMDKYELIRSGIIDDGEFESFFKRVSVPPMYQLVKGKVVKNSIVDKMMSGSKKEKLALEPKIDAELMTLLESLPKDVLVKCAKKMAKEKFEKAQAKLDTMPNYYAPTRAERYVNNLYRNNIPVYRHSTASKDLKEYAKQVGEMADAFVLNKTQLKAEWNRGITLTVGEKVHVGKSIALKDRLIQEIYDLENELEEVESLQESAQIRNQLKLKTAELEMAGKGLTDPLYVAEVVETRETNNGIEEGYVRVKFVDSVPAKSKKRPQRELIGKDELPKLPENVKDVPIRTVSRSKASDDRANIPIAFVMDGYRGLSPQDLAIHIRDLFEPIDWMSKVLGVVIVPGKFDPIFTPSKRELKNKARERKVIPEEVAKDLVKQRLDDFYKRALRTFKTMSSEQKKRIGEPPAPKFKADVESDKFKRYEYPDFPDFADTNPDDLFDIGDYDPFALTRYFNKMKKQPGLNPMLQLYTPVPNELREKLEKRTYSTLIDAIEDTPLNGYFTVSGGDPAQEFKELVFDKLTPTELAMIVKTYENLDPAGYVAMTNAVESGNLQKNPKGLKFIRQAAFNFFFQNPLPVEPEKKAMQPEIQVLRNFDKEGNYVPLVKNPEYEALIERAKDVDPESVELYDQLQEIDANFEEVEDGEDQDTLIITYRRKGETFEKEVKKDKLKQWLIKYINKYIGAIIPSKSSRVEIETDTSTGEKMIPDKYIKYLDWRKGGPFEKGFNPTFQKVALDKNYPGSFVISLESGNYRFRMADVNGALYKGWVISGLYKYPITYIDFEKYLRALRQKYVNSIDYFTQTERLSEHNIRISRKFRDKIDLITEYLGDGFEIAEPVDYDSKIIRRTITEFSDSMRISEDDVFEDQLIEETAAELESAVRNLFNTESVTEFEASYKKTVNKISYLLIVSKWARSGLLSGNLRNEDIINMSNKIFPKKIQSVSTWEPDNYILSELREDNEKAFNNMMAAFSTSEVIDQNIVDVYENEHGPMINLLKRGTLVELQQLRTWKNALGKAGAIGAKESVKRRYLIQTRNRLLSSDPKVPISVRYKNIKQMVRRYRTNMFVAADLETAIFGYCDNFEEYKSFFGLKNFDARSIIRRIEGGENDPISIVRMLVQKSKPEFRIRESYFDHAMYPGVGEMLGYREAKIVDVDTVFKTWNDLINNTEDPRILKAIQTTINSAVLYKRNVNKEVIEQVRESVRSRRKERKKLAEIYPNLLKEPEYYYTRDSNGDITRHLSDPSVGLLIPPEIKREELLTSLLQKHYLPRAWKTLEADVKTRLENLNFRDQVMQIRAGQGATQQEILESMVEADRLILSNMRYTDLERLRNEFFDTYIAPKPVIKVPVELAKTGVDVCPMAKRGLYLIGGKLPNNPKAYRYRDQNKVIRTELVNICEWMAVEYPSIVYPENFSLYGPVQNFEKKMMECVQIMKQRSFKLKLNSDLTINPNLQKAICDRMGVTKRTQGLVDAYWKANGGDRLIFPRGGTRQEYDAFMDSMMYDACIGNVIGVPGKGFSKLRSEKENLMLKLREVESKLMKYSEKFKFEDWDERTARRPNPRYRRRSKDALKKKKVERIKRRSREAYDYQKLYDQAMRLRRKLGELKKIEVRNSKKKAETEDMSILTLSDGTKIYRRIMHNRLVSYPVPIKYDLVTGEPIYDEKMVPNLQSLMKNGLMGEWLRNTKFEDAPFTIEEKREEDSEDDEEGSVGQGEGGEEDSEDDENRKQSGRGFSVLSNYYVEQTFTDKKYGKNFVVNIGIIPKSIPNKTGHAIVQKMPVPIEAYVTNSEKIRIDYFMDRKKAYTTSLTDRRLPSEKIVRKQGGYSMLDTRSTKPIQGLKYDPKDVWAWNPLEDKKAGAESDAKVWEVERSRQLRIVKKWLRKGSSSSSFIAAKNNATRQLEAFRQNLPSQKRKLTGTGGRNVKVFRPSKLKPDQEYKLRAWKYSFQAVMDQRREYVYQFIRYGLIKVNKQVLELLKNPRSLFPNYERGRIVITEFEDDYTFDILKLYGDERKPQWGISDTSEILTGVVYNMTYTRTLNFNARWEGENLKSATEEQKATLARMKRFLQSEPKLWDILVTIVDQAMAGPIYFNLDEPVEITRYDAIAYLGDSYQQNLEYRWYMNEIKKQVQGEDVVVQEWLHPGCKYRRVDLESYTKPNEYGVSQLTENPYVSVYSKPNTEINFYNMYTVGNDLHSKIAVSHNLARRAALFYEVDISDIRPCFKSNAPHVNPSALDQKKGAIPVEDSLYVINVGDIMKFLEKGRNWYCWYEMPDSELDWLENNGIKRGKTNIAREMKTKYVEFYKGALDGYRRAKDKKKFLKDLQYFIPRDGISREEWKGMMVRMNMIPLKKLISQMEAETSQRGFIDKLSFIPDFLDESWEYRKTKIDSQFQQETGYRISDFLENRKPELKLTVTLSLTKPKIKSKTTDHATNLRRNPGAAAFRLDRFIRSLNS